MEREKIDPEKFGDALKAWSKVKKIPLVKIARIANLHPNSIYCYMKRKKNAPCVVPSLAKAAAIADILGVTIDQLARGPFGEGLQDE